MANRRVLKSRFRVYEQVEQYLLKLLLITPYSWIRFVEVHVDFDAARSRCKRPKPGGVLDDGVDVDRHIARVRLACKQEQIADHSNCAIGLAFDESNRLALLSLQLV